MQGTVSYTVHSFLLTRRGEQEYSRCGRLNFGPYMVPCLNVPLYFSTAVKIKKQSRCFASLNPNTIKSYKILQKLSPKHAAHGVAQLPYPIYRYGKACLSKQPPLACRPGPSPSTRQVPGLSPEPGGRTSGVALLEGARGQRMAVCPIDLRKVQKFEACNGTHVYRFFV